MTNLDLLKEKNDAVILAHYYVDGEIQRVANYVGDSFYLAQVAQRLTNKTIVMAGVYFMGESVKILNPEKNVLMVDNIATCPMVDMISVDKIQEMRKRYDDLAVVCYINSSAEIKAHCDVCVTSSNALNIVNKLKEKNIFFVPDRNLGGYIKKSIKDKNIILNEGFCPVHNKITADKVMELKKLHSEAKVLVHPECKREVIDLADYVGSTKGIILEAGKSKEDEFIIVTEIGILAKLKELYPNKKFYFIEEFICSDMKLLNMEKLINTLANNENEIKVESAISEKALIPLERMLEMGAN